MGMKKILRKVFLGIFIVVIVGLAALAASIFMPEIGRGNTRVTMQDPSGKSYVVKQDGKDKYAVVKGEDGKLWGAEINADGSIGETKKSLEGIASDSDIIDSYDGPDIDVTNQVILTGQPSEVYETTTQNQAPANPNSYDVTTAAPVDNTPKLKKYLEIFSSNNYLMEFTTSDEKLGNTPITAAAKNGNILVDTSIDGITCKMLYLADKNKTYLLLDNYRKYCSVPQSLLGDDFNMSDLNMGSTLANSVDLSSIKQSTVMIDGKEFHCETCGNGASATKYYFDGDTLVRFDTTNEDGTASVTNFTRITTDVPDSTFEIPSNYGYINLDLLGLVGNIAS